MPLMSLEVNSKGLAIGAVLALVNAIVEIYKQYSGKELTDKQRINLVKKLNHDVAQGAIIGALPLPVQIPYVLSKLYLEKTPKIHKIPRQW